MDYNKEYKEIVKNCVDTGILKVKNLTNMGNFNAMYLYFIPSNKGGLGKLLLVNDDEIAPSEAKLVTGEGLRSNIPYDHYHQWIYDRARNCPILISSISLEDFTEIYY